MIIAIFKKKVILNLLYKNHCRAKEMLQMAQTGNLKELSALGKEDSSTVNISKKRKKKLTRKEKMNQIQIEGVLEEKMDALEIEDSEEELSHIPVEKPQENKKDLENFKEYLMQVMKTHGFAEERARKMHWSRFLELLQVLNANQIYFR